MSGLFPMVLSDKMLDEILAYLERSLENLAGEALESMEFEGGFEGVRDFLQGQFDIRLENLLAAKHSSIHHLESAMKSRVIQKRQEIFARISKRYKG